MEIIKSAAVLIKERIAASLVAGGGAEKEEDGYTVWFEAKMPSALGEEQVRVVLDRNLYNAAGLQGKAKGLADEEWNARVEANPKLFNATKFRLASIEENDDGSVTLGMGVSDYKTYLSTNRATDPIMCEALPSDEKDLRPLLSDIVGCTVLVMTSDNLVPIQRRSLNTAEFRGWWDVAGGHPEPSRAGLGIDETQDTEKGRPDPNEASRKEFFYSAIDEVHGELNVPISKIGQPVLCGVIRAHASRGRPHAILALRVALTGKELVDCYAAGGKETDESTCMALFSLDVLRSGEGEPSLVVGETSPPTSFKEIEKILVPCTNMCIKLLKKGLEIR